MWEFSCLELIPGQLGTAADSRHIIVTDLVSLRVIFRKALPETIPSLENTHRLDQAAASADRTTLARRKRGVRPGPVRAIRPLDLHLAERDELERRRHSPPKELLHLAVENGGHLPQPLTSKQYLVLVKQLDLLLSEVRHRLPLALESEQDLPDAHRASPLGRLELLHHFTGNHTGLKNLLHVTVHFLCQRCPLR